MSVIITFTLCGFNELRLLFICYINVISKKYLHVASDKTQLTVLFLAGLQGKA